MWMCARVMRVVCCVDAAKWRPAESGGARSNTENSSEPANYSVVTALLVLFMLASSFSRSRCHYWLLAKYLLIKFFSKRILNQNLFNFKIWMLYTAYICNLKNMISSILNSMNIIYIQMIYIWVFSLRLSKTRIFKISHSFIPSFYVFWTHLI